MGMKLPEHFKIAEEANLPLTFYYFDERNPKEKSCRFNNLKSLVKDCKKYADILDWINHFILPKGFRIECLIDRQIPALYFEDVKIQEGDIFELESIAIKNHLVYKYLNDLNKGLEVEL
jgi:hypothetical protein